MVASASERSAPTKRVLVGIFIFEFLIMFFMSKVKRERKTGTHKDGTKLPKTVQEVLEIDQLTGTTFWSDALAKER